MNSDHVPDDAGLPNLADLSLAELRKVQREYVGGAKPRFEEGYRACMSHYNCETLVEIDQSYCGKCAVKIGRMGDSETTGRFAGGYPMQCPDLTSHLDSPGSQSLAGKNG